MAELDTLIAVWNTTSLPANVTGTALAGGDTAAQKITKINGWTVATPAQPMIIPTYMIYNLIDPGEWSSVSAANQQVVRDIIGMGTVDASPGTPIRARLAAIFPIATFPVTRAALNALAASYDTPTRQPWYNAPVSQSGAGLNGTLDLRTAQAAGLS